MNRILPEESIHSFLIRKLSCVGALQASSSLNGIISPNGVVQPMPKVLGGFAGYFLKLGDCNRLKGISIPALEFINKSVEERGNHFEVDAHSFYDLGNFSEGNGLVGRTQQRFCKECFSQQVYEYGFTWFKFDWLYEEHCREHNKLMWEVRTNGCSCEWRGGIVNKIRSVMCGHCLICQDHIWDLDTLKYGSTNACRDHPSNYLFHDFVVGN